MQYAQDIAERKKRGQCTCEGCWRPSVKRSSLCNKHSRLRKIENNPYTFYLGELRRRAKRRGKTCTLTVQEFKDFCLRTGYLSSKGVNAGDSHIDRIDPDRGYENDNIQMLTNTENLKKKYADILRKNLATWKEIPIDVSEFAKPVTVDEEAPF